MKIKLVSTLALSALLLASCSNNDNDSGTELNSQRVKFSSGVSDNSLRVAGPSGNLWEGNEEIGIYMVGHGSTNVLEGAQNVKYTTTSTGLTAVFTNNTTPIYYPVDGTQKVDFIAYHPHKASVSNYVYPINVATQTSQSNIDLMLATANGTGTGYDKNNTSPVNLRFKHQLSKVIINVTAGNGIPNLTGIAVGIEGMNTTAKFDLTGVDGITDAATVASLTPYNNGSNSIYEAILLPLAAFNNNHVVKFTLGGNTYTWIVSNNSNSIASFVGGKKYTFNVTLNKNSVEVSGTIEEWDEVNGGNGSAN